MIKHAQNLVLSNFFSLSSFLCYFTIAAFCFNYQRCRISFFNQYSGVIQHWQHSLGLHFALSMENSTRCNNWELIFGVPKTIQRANQPHSVNFFPITFLLFLQWLEACEWYICVSASEGETRKEFPLLMTVLLILLQTLEIHDNEIQFFLDDVEKSTKTIIHPILSASTANTSLLLLFCNGESSNDKTAKRTRGWGKDIDADPCNAR